MSSNRILLLIVTALYFWLCHAFVHKICTDCDGCQDRTEEVTNTTAGAAATTDNTATANNTITNPIIFNWNNSKGITSNHFAAYRDSLAAELKDGKNVEVYGYYFKEEATPQGYANMGLARADGLIQLLAEIIPKNRITPRAQLLDEVEGIRTYPFISTSTRFIDAVDTKEASKEDLARVDVVGDVVLIYFPFGSVKKEVDPKIDAYLDKLAIQLKKSGQKVTLTGHTDDKGSDESNLALAERRAKVIRDILRKKNVPNAQIITQSKGKTEPTAPNDTDANRRLNRRVEVKLN